jgi:hypothetical protein
MMMMMILIQAVHTNLPYEPPISLPLVSHQ